METLNIKIILASIRDGRFGIHPAKWITDIAQKTEDISVELLDLKDYLLPMFADAVSPKNVTGSYGNAAVDAWAVKIAEADGFVIVTPEYNHGYPPSLKNNIDHLYNEWVHKPVCFVGYGTTGGARAIQQLRGVAIELQMSPIRNSVHIFNPWNLVDEKGDIKPGVLDDNVKSAEAMLGQLIWWGKTLKTARKEV